MTLHLTVVTVELVLRAAMTQEEKPSQGELFDRGPGDHEVSFIHEDASVSVVSLQVSIAHGPETVTSTGRELLDNGKDHVERPFPVKEAHILTHGGSGTDLHFGSRFNHRIIIPFLP